MLSWLTKKPAKSMNGMMRTGVRATANCLSEKIVLIISEYDPAAQYNKIKIATISIKPHTLTKERE